MRRSIHWQKLESTPSLAGRAGFFQLDNRATPAQGERATGTCPGFVTHSSRELKIDTTTVDFSSAAITQSGAAESFN